MEIAKAMNNKLLIKKRGNQMRRKVVAGNWKMNMLPNEAMSFIRQIESEVNNSKAEVILCVPYTDLFYSLLTAQDTKIKIGAQNMHWEEKGAYTGEISGQMLKCIGVEYVIIGHSERRQYFAETDETVNKKVKAAHKYGLKPIVCVGENLEQRESGKIFKKENAVIILNETNPDMIENEQEKEIFKMLYEASKDGILESKEFEKWCNVSYSRILKWFDNILDKQRDILVNEGLIIAEEKTSFKIFTSTIYTATPELKKEAIELAGLKKYLKEYTLIKDREAIEVVIFEEYLIYAQIMGIAKEVAKEFKDIYPFVEVVPTSGLKNDNVDHLISVIKKYLHDEVKYFPDEYYTSSSMKFMASEIVREKLLQVTEDEIPHSITCITTLFEEKKDIVNISVDIIVDRDNVKRIIIGKNGSRLKTVGTLARTEIESELVGKKVYLELFVKTIKNWKDKEKYLVELGFIDNE